MKKKNPIVLVLIFLMSIVCLTACSEQEKTTGVSESESSNALFLYGASQSYILDRNEQALKVLTDYMERNIATKSYVSGDSTKLNLITDFEKSRGIQSVDLANYLVDNPNEIDELISTVCSVTFYEKFENVTEVYTPERLSAFLDDVYKSDKLSNYEKTILMLLVASENNYNPATRSVSSCIKRYAKLAQIAAKATAISLVDMQSGVEYATRELKNMGKEYDC